MFGKRNLDYKLKTTRIQFYVNYITPIIVLDICMIINIKYFKQLNQIG